MVFLATRLIGCILTWGLPKQMFTPWWERTSTQPHFPRYQLAPPFAACLPLPPRCDDCVIVIHLTASVACPAAAVVEPPCDVAQRTSPVSTAHAACFPLPPRS
jgi:hypothetical protein